MDLPNLLNKIKTNPQEVKQFVAIEIAADSVKTAVWRVISHHTEIVSIGSIQSWEEATDDDLLIAIDTSLSEALTGMENEPDEVIFGLPEPWVGKENIAEDKKPILKTICQKLGLKPVGFVVTTEAVVHYLRDTEGGPPSAILIGLSHDEILVSLVYLGKLQGMQVVGRSPDINSDIEEGLARFPQRDNFPSRMILYNSKEDLEELKQDILTYDWQERIPFLHFPQVEILPKDGTIKAVALSGGAEVAKSMGLKAANPTTDKPPAAAVAPVPTESPSKEMESDPNTDEFGFADLDISPEADEPEMIAMTSATNHEESIETLDADDESAPASPQDSDIQSSGPDNNLPAVEPELVPVDEKEVFPEPEADQPKTSLLNRIKQRIPRPSLPKRAPKVNKASSSSPLKKLKLPKLSAPPLIIMGIIILLLIAGGGTYAYWHIPKAQVNIFVQPESFPRQVEFTLSPQITQPDLQNRIIPATATVSEKSGQTSTPTTGSKTVGERAKGRVEIFNRTLSSKTLPAGTTIADGSLQFTLDDDVSIASASSQENEDFSITRRPSSQEVAVTAADIGSEYNISQGTEFTIANFAQEDFIARGTAAFSGGSSRQVQVVSQDDMDRLEEDLITDLTQQVQQDVAQQSQGQQGVITAGESEVTSQEYSAQAGEEATQVSLQATVVQDLYTYSLKDISLLGQQAILDEIPPGFTILPEETVVEVDDSQISEDGTAQVSADINLKLMPNIDTQDVARNLTGKYPRDVEEYLRGLPNYVRTQTTITPSLPRRLATFPRLTENISISVKPTLQP